jgi:hypothetical protein
MGVDYDLVLLPPNVDIDAISEALSVTEPTKL